MECFASIVKHRFYSWLASCLVIFCGLPVAPSLADSLLVPSQYPTIQSAIDAAQNGDEVVVSPGEYHGRVAFKGKGIVLRSVDPLDDAIVAQTILTGTSDDSGVLFNSNEPPGTRLAGFTLLRTRGVQYQSARLTSAQIDHNVFLYTSRTAITFVGGPIEHNKFLFGDRLLNFCTGPVRHNLFYGNFFDYQEDAFIDYCEGEFSHNVFQNNSNPGGYGVFNSCSGPIRFNRFVGNSSKYGAAINGCRGPIEGNLIYRNTAAQLGGGISRCNSQIANNTMWGNKAGVSGGGLSLYDSVSNIKLFNNIIWGNEAPSAPQLAHSSNFFNYAVVKNNVIQDWSGPTFPGLITDDPQFDEVAAYSFLLQSTSPCIDAGTTTPMTVAMDFYGRARLGPPPDLLLDIGATEFYPGLPSGPAPLTPAAISPLFGQTVDSLQTRLESSPFDNPDTATRHLASQWQLAAAPDQFSPPLFDSFDDYYYQAFYVVPLKVLMPDRAYYWRVRHLGDNMRWSDWSAPSMFFTPAPTQVHVPADYPTIQAAIDAANEFDEVVVAPGNYPESVNLKNKTLTLRSTNPLNPAIVDATRLMPVYQSQNLLYSIYLSGGEGPETRITGLTLSGGIYGTNATIMVERNRFTLQGAVLVNGTIFANRFIAGQSGLAKDAIVACNGQISNNTIRGFNVGIRSVEGVIENNLILNNNQTGLYFCNGTIRHNVIVGNGMNPIYSGIEVSGLRSCQGAIYNNIIWNNSEASGRQIIHCDPVNYSITDGEYAGDAGIIVADPRFVDPENGDYRLLPSSPAIDAGQRLGGEPPDPDGVPRPQLGGFPQRGDGSGVDMGAFEFVGPGVIGRPHAPVNLSPADGLTTMTTLIRLISSPFADDSPHESHWASRWQLSLQPDFQSVLLDTGAIQSALTELTPPWDIISPNLTIFWRVRHQNNNRVWGDWSAPTQFTTLDIPADAIMVPDDMATVQAALNAAPEGGVIVLRPGNYIGKITFPPRKLTLRSENPADPNVVAATVIDGDGAGPVVTLSLANNSATLIDGLTIANGNRTGPGGGVYGGGSRATIHRCVIRNNTATTGGGFSQCDGLIWDCLIRDNQAKQGGGLSECNGTIWGGAIQNNSAVDHGGGLFNCNARISFALIEGNQADIGGGLLGCNATVRWCRIERNKAKREGGAVYAGTANLIHCSVSNNLGNPYGGIFNMGGLIEQCVFHGNAAGAGLTLYQLIELNSIYHQNTASASKAPEIPVSGGVNRQIILKDVTFDPRFANPSAGDFRLLPGSPGIDGGSVFKFYNDEERPPARGAHRGDLGLFGGRDNGDVLFLRLTELADFLLGRRQMTEGKRAAADLDGDGDITAADLILFITHGPDPANMVHPFGPHPAPPPLLD